MEAERLAIEEAYAEVVANLNRCKAIWLQDMQVNSEAYEGITKDDAFVWFVECM